MTRKDDPMRDADERRAFADAQPDKVLLHTAILSAMLAREFGRELTGYLDARQMAEANERNAIRSWHTGICHTHDYADTNMAMDGAFNRLMGRSPIPEAGEMTDADIALWNAAWGIAQSRRFWGDPQEAEFAEWQATREACPDLGAQMDDDSLTGVPGLIYEGGYIEEPVGGCRGCRWHLIIERSEWESDDLEELERILFFEWVLPNGFIVDQRADETPPM